MCYNPFMRSLALGTLIVIFLVITPLSLIRAQEEETGSATLSIPDIEQFPTVKAFLTLTDAFGEFTNGLSVDDVLVIEDGTQITPDILRQLRPGAQFVTAFNPGRSFALRNSSGISRYDMLIEALTNWGIRRSGSNIDDLSLLVPSGPQVIHTRDLVSWIDQLDRIDREMAREMEPDIDVLSRAIDLAADAPSQPGMGRSILFITPPLESEYVLPLEGLISRANQDDVQINIWMVAAEGAYSQQAAEQLISLAEKTGGQFAVFTGDNQITDPEIYLEPLRSIYELEYQSEVTESGQHQLHVVVETPSGRVASQQQSFGIAIQPPNPAFVSPPLEINRVPSTEDRPVFSEDPTPEEYIPTDQVFHVIVSFPDEWVRPLKRTTLLVNGVVVDENTEPPFEFLSWDISGLTNSNDYIVRVEAEDTLGLVGSTLEQMITINVEVPEENPLSWVYENIILLAGLTVLVLASLILLLLVFRGRIQPKRIEPGNSQSRKTQRNRRPPEKAPSSTQGVRLSRWMSGIHLPLRGAAESTLATLNHITENEDSSTRPPLVITSKESSIGSDPQKCTLVVDDPTVETIHTRILMNADHSFWVWDEDTIAGTWVNFTRVPEDGALLEHGNSIHIGQIGFRFNVRNPANIRKPVSQFLEEN